MYFPGHPALATSHKFFIQVFSFPLSSKYFLFLCDLFILSLCYLEMCCSVPKYVEIFQIAAIDF